MKIELINLVFPGGGSSSASSKSATIEMFVGSSYNETMGDTLSDVSDRSSNYFTSDLEHRNHHIQVYTPIPGE